MRKLIFFSSLTMTCWAVIAQEIPQRHPNVPGQNDFEDMKMMRAISPKNRHIKNSKSGAQVSLRGATEEPILPSSIPIPNPEIEPPKAVITLPSPSGNSLSKGEALAACFALLKLPPPFEDAFIRLPTNMAILLVDPSAYLGHMAPFSGVATWSQVDGRIHTEPFTSRGGYLILRWPSKALGSPNPGSLTLHMNRPTLAVQFLWSDFTLYGADIPKLLLQQVPNWELSTRKLDLTRSGYRESMFPADLQSAIRDPAVSPVLEPLLAKAAPQLLHQLKGGSLP